MLTADECKRISCEAEIRNMKEEGEFLDSQWKMILPNVERVLGVINYKIREAIGFECECGRYCITMHIIDEIMFYIGIKYIDGETCDKMISYIINSIYNKYTSAGFMVEIKDNRNIIKISWN